MKPPRDPVSHRPRPPAADRHYRVASCVDVCMGCGKRAGADGIKFAYNTNAVTCAEAKVKLAARRAPGPVRDEWLAKMEANRRGRGRPY